MLFDSYDLLAKCRIKDYYKKKKARLLVLNRFSYSFDISRLDYCNNVLARLPCSLVQQL